MMKDYVVRDIVGPAGQKIAGRLRMAGNIVRLSDEEAERELKRLVIELPKAAKVSEPAEGNDQAGDDAGGNGSGDGDPGAGGPSNDEKPLYRMNKEELLAVAKEKGIALPDEPTNAEIKEAIENA